MDHSERTAAVLSSISGFGVLSVTNEMSSPAAVFEIASFRMCHFSLHSGPFVSLACIIVSTD